MLFSDDFVEPASTHLTALSSLGNETGQNVTRREPTLFHATALHSFCCSNGRPWGAPKLGRARIHMLFPCIVRGATQPRRKHDTASQQISASREAGFRGQITTQAPDKPRNETHGPTTRRCPWARVGGALACSATRTSWRTCTRRAAGDARRVQPRARGFFVLAPRQDRAPKNHEVQGLDRVARAITSFAAEAKIGSPLSTADPAQGLHLPPESAAAERQKIRPNTHSQHTVFRQALLFDKNLPTPSTRRGSRTSVPPPNSADVLFPMM